MCVSEHMNIAMLGGAGNQVCFGEHWDFAMLGRREIKSVLEQMNFAMLGMREIRSVLEHTDFAMLGRQEIKSVLEQRNFADLLQDRITCPNSAPMLGASFDRSGHGASRIRSKGWTVRAGMAGRAVG